MLDRLLTTLCVSLALLTSTTACPLSTRDDMTLNVRADMAFEDATNIAANMELEARQLTQPPSQCATQFHLMVAAGCRIPCPADVPSLLTGLTKRIATEFPGSTSYYVPYNNSLNQVAVSTPQMIQAFNLYVLSCPKTPVMFLGYSAGGIVIMNSICGGINPALAPRVIGTALYGEETFRAGQYWDRGSCAANAPLYPRASITACIPFGARTRSWCDEHDGKCCGTGNLTEYPDAHFKYPKRYNDDVLSFMHTQWSEFEANPTF